MFFFLKCFLGSGFWGWCSRVDYATGDDALDRVFRFEIEIDEVFFLVHDEEPRCGVWRCGDEYGDEFFIDRFRALWGSLS